jgi:hypothetical protein
MKLDIALVYANLRWVIAMLIALILLKALIIAGT